MQRWAASTSATTVHTKPRPRIRGAAEGRSRPSRETARASRIHPRQHSGAAQRQRSAPDDGHCLPFESLDKVVWEGHSWEALPPDLSVRVRDGPRIPLEVFESASRIPVL